MPPREKQDAPEPEDFDAKEVYAFFGLTSYWAQVLERGVINLAVVLNLAGIREPRAEAVDALFDQFEPKTLGQLLLAVSKLTPLPNQLEVKLRAALSERNRLSHRFFFEHAERFMSEAGRSIMLSELSASLRLFREADDLATELLGALLKQHGYSAQELDQEFQAMLLRAALSAGDA